MNNEDCDFCDGVVKATVMRIPFHYRHEVIYVDNVPVQKCRKCGELYFEAAVVKRLEAIAEKRKSIRTKISFPLRTTAKAWLLKLPDCFTNHAQRAYKDGCRGLRVLV
jgi:YgiT-type zinc finger domain-containing protein